MKKWSFLVLALGYLSSVLAGGMADYAGVWTVWRTEPEAPAMQLPVCFVLAADGNWNVAQPSESVGGGSFTVKEPQLTLKNQADGEEGDELVLTIQDPNTLISQEEDNSAIELRRTQLSKADLEARVVGDWDLTILNEDGSTEQAPFYFQFAADGSWEAVVVDAESGMESQNGTYVVDDALFLIMNNAEGGEQVFYCNGEYLNGLEEQTALRCTKRQ